MKAITEEYNSLRKQFAELELALVTKEEILTRVQQDKEFFRAEMNNLKEYNQVYYLNNIACLYILYGCIPEWSDFDFFNEKSRWLVKKYEGMTSKERRKNFSLQGWYSSPSK